MNWSEDHAIKRELRHIRMDTWADNPNLIKYYKSFGFQIVGNFITPNSEELLIQQRNNSIVLLEFEIKSSKPNLNKNEVSS